MAFVLLPGAFELVRVSTEARVTLKARLTAAALVVGVVASALYVSGQWPAYAAVLREGGLLGNLAS